MVSVLLTVCMHFCAVSCVVHCCRCSDLIRFIAEPVGRNLFAIQPSAIRKNT